MTDTCSIAFQGLILISAIVSRVAQALIVFDGKGKIEMNGGYNRIHIGTSGWSYEHWRGPFYPKNIKTGTYFDFYSSRFDTVEINNSFYQLPEKETLEKWKHQAPDDFIFSVKASRYITHMKKLKDPREAVKKFFERIKTLNGKQGPILFQLPPKWKANAGRLDAFLSQLPNGYRYTFEFRDPDWFSRDVYQVLEKHNAALCIYGMGDYDSPRETTADFVYVRLHGPEGNYKGQYSIETLSGWAGAFYSWMLSGKDIFCYFDNDDRGFAATDALKLKDMLSAHGVQGS